MFTKYFTCNTKQKADRQVSQDSKSAREELGAWKIEINWNNCYRYYGHSQQNHFAGSTIASLNQLLLFSCIFTMWNYDSLDLRRVFALQVRKLWQNLLFAGPNMKACYSFKTLKFQTIDISSLVKNGYNFNKN